MNHNQTFSTLQPLFQSVFKDDQLTITLTTTQADIDQWDSLNHAILIDAIEKHFDVKFDLMDMLRIQSVGDICDLIATKKGK